MKAVFEYNKRHWQKHNLCKHIFNNIYQKIVLEERVITEDIISYFLDIYNRPNVQLKVFYHPDNIINNETLAKSRIKRINLGSKLFTEFKRLKPEILKSEDFLIYIRESDSLLDQGKFNGQIIIIENPLDYYSTRMACASIYNCGLFFEIKRGLSRIV